MGTTLKIICESCGHSKEYMLGVGMIYSSLENVIEEVHPAKRDYVLSLLKRKDLIKTDYSHSLYA
jgi:archaellum component FlaF (FlaF/FlaG flagellin family)